MKFNVRWDTEEVELVYGDIVKFIANKVYHFSGYVSGRPDARDIVIWSEGTAKFELQTSSLITEINGRKVVR